jgi:hypothetical protein
MDAFLLGILNLFAGTAPVEPAGENRLGGLVVLAVDRLGASAIVEKIDWVFALRSRCALRLLMLVGWPIHRTVEQVCSLCICTVYIL